MHGKMNRKSRAKHPRISGPRANVLPGTALVTQSLCCLTHRRPHTRPHSRAPAACKQTHSPYPPSPSPPPFYPTALHTHHEPPAIYPFTHNHEADKSGTGQIVQSMRFQCHPASLQAAHTIRPVYPQPKGLLPCPSR